MQSERFRGILMPLSLSSASGSSNDDNFPLDRGDFILPQRNDSRLKPFRGTDIDDYYMVLTMMNQFVAIGEQLRVTRGR